MRDGMPRAVRLQRNEVSPRWLRGRVALRRLFRVATIDGHYCVAWVAGDSVAHRQWRWWRLSDWTARGRGERSAWYEEMTRLRVFRDAIRVAHDEHLRT